MTKHQPIASDIVLVAIDVAEERVFAAQENIQQARKSTLFMTPPSRGFELMREAALSLAVSNSFARPLVNPRQTTAITFPQSAIQTPDNGVVDDRTHSRRYDVHLSDWHSAG